MEELTSTNPMPTFANFDADCLDDYDALGTVATVDCQLEKSYTWSECINACEIIRQFLAEKHMGSELLAFETFQHKLRVKRIDVASSQLSIKSFSNKK